MLAVKIKSKFASKTTLCLLISCLLLLQPAVFGQKVEREEIVVSFVSRGLFSEEFFVQYDGEHIYLPLLEVLSALDMFGAFDRANQRVEGFLFTPSDKFTFDYKKLEVSYGGKKHAVSYNQFMVESTDLFLRVDQFKRLFGLPFEFDFSELRVSMPADKRLPLYQKLLRKRLHKKLKQKEKEIGPVYRLPLKRSWFSGGALDWQISNSLVGRQNHFYGFDLGSSVLGGDLVVSGGGSKSQGFDPEQMRYRWNFAFQDNSYITKASLGEVYTVGALGRSLNGAMVTNRPLVQRRYYQTINVSDIIGPNWEVELYIDNELVDVVTTDSRGEYNFNVDLVYGNTLVTLKMYGPNGEIKSEDKYFLVPFNLIPKGEFEYTIAAGESKVLRENRRYAQAQAFYGVSSWLTAGLGLEQPLGAPGEESIRFAGELGVQVGGGLTFSTAIAPKRSIGINGSFSRSSSFSLAAGFTKYWPDEFFNPFNREYRAIFSASAPLKIKSTRIGLRYYISVDKFPTVLSTNMNYGISGSAGRVNLNLLGKFSQSKYETRTVNDLVNQIFATVHIYKWIRPQFRVAYNHSKQMLDKYGLYIGRRVFKTAQLSVSYERNETLKTDAVQVTFHLFTGFLTSTTRGISTNRGSTVSQVQRGSILYDGNTHSIRFDRRNNVGYASAVVRPYLDRNYNSQMDQGEEWLEGIRPKMKGPSGIPSGKNNLHYFNRLRPYDNYLIQIDQNSLDDPTLKAVYENYMVTVGPNVVTAIDVPVVVTSDISGTVNRLLPQGGEIGVGGIKIRIVNITTDELTELTTFNDGEYYYLGLTPGSYRAYIDPKQLEQYGYVSKPGGIDFIIEPTEGGTSIEDISFKIVSK